MWDQVVFHKDTQALLPHRPHSQASLQVSFPGYPTGLIPRLPHRPYSQATPGLIPRLLHRPHSQASPGLIPRLSQVSFPGFSTGLIPRLPANLQNRKC